MSTIRKIAKNTGFLLAGRLTTKVISLFTVIYIVRYLGDINYGKYAFAFAFISFFGIISELGTHNILVREISRSAESSRKLLGNAVLISIFFSIIASILSILAINLMNYPIETKEIVQIASLGLLLGGIAPFATIYEVNLEMKYTVFFGLLSRISLLIATLIVISYDLGLTWLVIVTVVADVLYSFLIMIYSKRLINPVFKFDIDVCKFLLKESLPLALSSVFIIIYFRIDVVMLSMFKGDSDVGIYSAAYRITEAFTFIPSIFMISMFPLMSKYFEKSKEDLIYMYTRSFKYLISISLPLAAGITFYANEIIITLYANQFQESVIVLKILIWATAIMFINYSLSNLIISINKQKVTTISTATCAFINIALNSALIPSLSYQGAALATLITECINALIMLYYLQRFINLRTLIKHIKVPAAATILMYIFMIAANNFSEFLIIFSLLLYPVLIYLLGGIDNEDKEIFVKLIGKSKQRVDPKA